MLSLARLLLDFKVNAARCVRAHYVPGRSPFLPNLLRPSLLRPEIHLHFITQDWVCIVEDSSTIRRFNGKISTEQIQYMQTIHGFFFCARTAPDNSDQNLSLRCRYVLKVSFPVKLGTPYFTERKGTTHMENTTYAYVRVSTQEQNEARQLTAMRQFGVEEENIIVEKLSGKDFRRPRYQRLVRSIKPGDVLVVQSIDRLGRNYDEILEQWGVITKKRKAAIVVLDMPLLDTRQGRDLTGTLIADIVLQLLSYVAQRERENIRQRQAEGITAAKERGVQFGRERIKLPEDFPDFARLWQEGSISSRCAAKELGMSYKTFQRRAKELLFAT